MRVAKPKWMRQALKRIGYGVTDGQSQFVSGLRSQLGSTMAGLWQISSAVFSVCV